MTGGTWALVPVRAFSSAKTRLAPAVSPAGREELARAMLSDVLAVLSRSAALQGILIVSGDAEVARLGADYGVATLLDPIDAGTNAAVQLGLDHLKSVGSGPAVVVQSDIPLLTDAEFSGIVAALDDHDMAIAPARRDRGTNVLALSRPDILAPAFGERSFERHMASAAALSMRVAVLDLPGAGHDVDVPSDLSFGVGRGAGSHTMAALRRLRAYAGNGVVR